MTPIPLKATTFDQIVAKAKKVKAVYDSLTPEQRQEVDEYNRRLIISVEIGDVDAIKALPVNPMLAHMERAKKP